MLVKRIWRKRHSIILTWLLSYLTVLFVPIGISVAVYSKSIQTLESEIRRANETLLTQVRDVIDNQIDNIERLNTEITWNTRVQDLLYSHKSLGETMYTAYQVTNDLRLYKSSYPSIDEYYVYWNAQDAIILPGTVRYSRLAFETLHEGGELTYNDWMGMLRKKNFKAFISLPDMDSGTKKNTLAYITSLPGGKDPNLAIGSVVIMMDIQNLLQTVASKAFFKGGAVYILNKDNRVLLSNTKSNPRLLSFATQLKDDSGFFYERYNGSDSEIFYIKSKSADLKLVSIVPRSLFWKKAEYLRTLTYLSLLISLIGGGVLAFIFLRRNYSPVNRLIQSFADRSKSAESKVSNEFRYLQNMINQSLAEHEQTKLRLKQQNNILRSNMLGRLLKGKLNGQIPLDSALTVFGIRFDSEDFAVLMFYFEDNDAFFSRLRVMDENEKVKLLYFVSTNVVEELTRRKHAGYVAEIDDFLVCLVNFRTGDGEDRRKEELLGIASESQRFLLQSYHIGLTVSVSAIHHTVLGISQAYKEALDAMEYKLVLGKKEIIAYDDILSKVGDAPSGYYYPLQVEQQLTNYMNVGDFAKAEAVLNEIMERNFKPSIVSIQHAKCLMFNLISTMIKTIHEIEGIEESVFGRKTNWIDETMQCETFQEMHAQLTRLLQEVCAHKTARLKQQAEQKRLVTRNELVDEIYKFVDSSYDDLNLNISMVGRQFKVKPAYLSKLFKEHTGNSLLEHINKIRIEKAKELITREPANVGDIAKKVGFGETATFIRVFKKYEGITPGKYKEMIS